MIESVLKDVREAEAKAEQMQKEAYQRGKEIVLKAEAEAEAQKKSTVRECKQERAAALEDARRKSLERAQFTFKKGVEKASAMAEKINPAIEEMAEKVVAMFIGKYVEQEESAEDDEPLAQDGLDEE